MYVAFRDSSVALAQQRGGRLPVRQLVSQPCPGVDAALGHTWHTRRERCHPVSLRPMPFLIAKFAPAI